MEKEFKLIQGNLVMTFKALPIKSTIDTHYGDITEYEYNQNSEIFDVKIEAFEVDITKEIFKKYDDDEIIEIICEESDNWVEA